jgi:hypothetical protein
LVTSKSNNDEVAWEIHLSIYFLAFPSLIQLYATMAGFFFAFLFISLTRVILRSNKRNTETAFCI